MRPPEPGNKHLRFPRDRLWSVIRSFPSSPRKRLRQYIKGLERRSSAQRFLDQKYWTVIPNALARVRHGGRMPTESFLDDVLWGQYCIFLFVRIRDDLFDAHVHGRQLQVAADMILEEGTRAFARHFDRQSSFWNAFRTLLAGTQKAIADVDMLQRRVRSPRVILRLYAKVSAIFKIGLAAVCIQCDRRNQFKQIAACFDEIATAGHIVDDLEDVDEDLRRKRFNYVAAVILRKSKAGTSHRDRDLHVARTLLYGDGTARIMREARLHLTRAEEALQSLRLPEVRSYLRMQRANVALLSQTLQKRRIPR
jgi:hypothetical protein